MGEKINLHEDRVCELHFETNMFLNAYRNRLQPTALPTLHLIAGSSKDVMSSGQQQRAASPKRRRLLVIASVSNFIKLL